MARTWHSVVEPDRDQGTLVADTTAWAEADLRAVVLAKTDPRAFAPIYERYRDPVFVFCHRRLGSVADAADATSTVFLRALTALPAFQPRRADRGSTVRAWLFMIARNVVTDTWRSRKSHVPLEGPAAWNLADPARSPEAHVLDDEEVRLVNALLTSLPERQRAVVELRLAGLATAEVAHALDLSESAVKSLQVRGYRELRHRLTESSTLLTRERTP